MLRSELRFRAGIFRALLVFDWLSIITICFKKKIPGFSRNRVRKKRRPNGAQHVCLVRALSG
uniref:Uncharacterized protein n=1 Tax=Candidatus Kentrum sp. DK TaxID=2126562 RepID=A0A450THY0_9GAMM|nr:MAG: hypothetical protein BECKDK2373B_GA0170837_11793 [Candidatus Kentron sp. DK]